MRAARRQVYNSAMLKLKRRHTPQCRHRHKGEDYLNCSCPLWAKGFLNDRRYRRSLKTRDLQRAAKRLAEIESPDALPMKPIKEATSAFVKHGHYLAEASLTKRTLRMEKLEDYAAANGIEYLSEFTVEYVEDHLISRKLSKITTVKELETLRQFFEYCRDREWIRKNPAKRATKPKNLKPTPVEPYTPEEVGRILAACNRFGRTAYERLRARAMVMTLRYTGLRISDVATLALDRIRDDRLLLYTKKTGQQVYLPLHPELKQALETLPAPRGEPAQTHFFWNGISTVHSAVNVAERTLQRVFELSGVKGAHSHRFRHTLATDILVKGGTEQDVADVLGISPAIVRKHYAKWTQARQERITALMQRVHGASLPAGDDSTRGKYIS